MTLKDYHLTSDAMLMDLQGDINLSDERLDLVVALEPLRGAGTAIGRVPLLGKTAEVLAKIYFEVKGPFEEPEIRPATTKKIGDAVKSGGKEAGTTINDVVNGLKKIF